MTTLEKRCAYRSFNPAQKEDLNMCYQCRGEYVEKKGDVCRVCNEMIDHEIEEILSRLRRK